jgi:hypothetical protein
LRPRLGIVLVLAAAGLAAIGSGAAVVGAQARPQAGTALEPVMQQLEAFRRDDFDTAYGFASAQIRQLFDRASFERMVRVGYPEIARSSSAALAELREEPDGPVYLRLLIQGANGRSVDAVYEMVVEEGAWKINGVVARPSGTAA